RADPAPRPRAAGRRDRPAAPALLGDRRQRRVRASRRPHLARAARGGRGGNPAQLDASARRRRAVLVMESAPGRGPMRNLLILHTPHFQERSDWETVKAKIDARAPDIEVRIDDNLQPSPETGDWQMSRPSLVFSAFALVGYRPRGGAVFAGKHMGKGAEWLQ